MFKQFSNTGIHLFREHDDQFVMLIENITKERVEEFPKHTEKD